MTSAANVLNAAEDRFDRSDVNVRLRLNRRRRVPSLDVGGSVDAGASVATGAAVGAAVALVTPVGAAVILTDVGTAVDIERKVKQFWKQ